MQSFSQFPNDENGAVLRQMQESGDDLSIPRDINFSVIFKSKGNAKKFAEHFSKLGYEVEVIGPGLLFWQPWDVTVIKHMIPDHKDITAFEQQLDLAARPLGGQNDGWGCFQP